MIGKIFVSLGILGVSLMGYAQRYKAPESIGAVPTEAQIAWQRLETYAFVHFGLNTYNDLEWGYGDSKPSTFAPDTLDVEQWVRTFKQAGMQGVILTAKHHDGFCLWPTKTTDYSVKNSPWQDGRGDLVRELSDACHRYGLRFGLYLSPWDRHHSEYGRAEYQRVFHEQIRELTTGYGPLFEYWFDGANGGTGWYGGANESRSIDPNTYYQYEEAAKMLRANNPDIMIFGGTVPTIRWIGNEQGWAGQTNYSTYDLKAERHYKQSQWGMRGASSWIPGEVDVSIRPGWFYHQREDHQVRTVANLTELYYQSVGRNANLLLNFPVALDGRIPKTDSLNAVQWYQHIQQSFKHNIVQGSKVSAKPTRRGYAFAPRYLVDGNQETYWAMPDGSTTGEVVLRFDRQRINTIALQEYIRLGQRVDEFALETLGQDGVWMPIQTTDSLTTIGYKRLVRFTPTETDGIRLRITKSRGPVCLSELGAYLTATLVEPPVVYRDASDKLIIHAASATNRLRYRLTDSVWQTYREPIELTGDLLHLEVEAYDPQYSQQVARTARALGYSPRRISVEGLTEDDRARMLDGDGHTAIELPKGVTHVDLKLDEPRPIKSLVYTPDQRRDASGHIQLYALYIDGQLVAEGEFANIKHNPITTAIELSRAVVGQHIRLEARRLVGDSERMTIGSLELY